MKEMMGEDRVMEINGMKHVMQNGGSMEERLKRIKRTEYGEEAENKAYDDASEETYRDGSVKNECWNSTKTSYSRHITEADGDY